ncbi:MAG: biotin transporter BioY [Anaerolineales bacterium]|nr:biotin transporter BioY [Anaerolineales bacterium]
MTLPPQILARPSVQWSLAGVTAAVLGISSWLTIPFWPVPLTLQTLVLFTAALLFGHRISVLTVLLYWALGIIGVPVFAGGASGFGTFLGPTGGFLLGFLPASLITALIGRNVTPSRITPYQRRLTYLKALILGHIALYGLGVTWLGVWLNFNWTSALLFGVLLFLPGDILKGIATLILVPRLVQILAISDTTSENTPSET